MSAEGLIQKFYIGFYGRPADFAGLTYWSDRLESEGVQRIMEAFASSYEARNFVFQDPVTGRSYESRELVNHIYQHLFGRNAEPAGLDFYTGKLEAGDMTAVSIVRNVMDGALKEDLVVLNNKLQVAEYFTGRVEAKDLDYESDHIEIARASLEGRVLDLSQAIQQADVCLEQMTPESESALFSIDGPEGTPQTVWVFDGHTDDVFGMVAGKSGNLYSVSKDGSVCRIDSKTGEALWRFDGHTDLISYFAVDAEGDVYTSSADDTVRKVDGETGDQIWVFDGHTDDVLGVFVDQNGHAYSSSADGSLQKIDSETGEALWRYDAHGAYIRFALVNNQDDIFIADFDDTVRKLDAETGEEIWSFDGHRDAIGYLALGSEGNVLSAGKDDTVRKVDQDTGEGTWTFYGHTEEVNGVVVDGDNDVLSGGDDDTLWKIEGDTGKAIWHFDGHANDVHSAVADGNGDVFSAGADATVRKVDGDTGEEIWRYDAHDRAVNLVRVDAAGDAYTASDDNTVRKISSSEPVFQVAQGDSVIISAEIENIGENEGSREIGLTFADQAIDWEAVRELSLSPGASETIRFDLDTAALGLDARNYELEMTSGDDTDIFTLDVINAADAAFFTIDTGGGFAEEAWTIEFDTESVNSVAVDSDGYVYTGGKGSGYDTVKKIDSDSGEIVQVWTAQKDSWFYSSPDMAVDSQGNVYIGEMACTLLMKMDAETGDELWSYDGMSTITSVALDSDGDVYGGSKDDTVRKIDGDTGEERWSFSGHTGDVWDVAVNAQGDVYSAAYDETVRKLDGSTGEEIWCYEGHNAPVFSIAAAPGGDVYSAGDINDSLTRIDTDTGEAVWSIAEFPFALGPVAVDKDGDAYFSADSDVHKADGDTGKLIWSFDNGTSLISDVAVDTEGNVYTVSEDRTLCKISQDDYAHTQVQPGETATIIAPVENSGDGPGSREVTLSFLDEAIGWSAQKTVTLEPEESEKLAFQLDTDALGLKAGKIYDLECSTGDTSEIVLLEIMGVAALQADQVSSLVL